MSLEPVTGVLETIGALLAKFWTGVLASIISIKFVPEGSTRFDRAFSAFCGVVLTISFGPIVVELTGLDGNEVIMGVGAVIGLFGLLIVAEVVKGIKQMQLAGVLTAIVRKWLRIGD